MTPLSDLWLKDLKRWFCRYCASFLNDNAEHNYHIALKRGHSLRVCVIMRRLGCRLGLSGPALIMGQALGLLHDLGRFEQYDRFRTFSDQQSFDHGAHGAALIEALGLLADCTACEREALLAAVRRHNKADLDLFVNRQGAALQWAQMVRDADKLDIWYVVTRYYLRRPPPAGSAADIRLPDLPYVSPAVLTALKQQRSVSTTALRTQYDRVLFLMGWIFDLNYAVTLEWAMARGYLEWLYHSVAPQPDFTTGYGRVRDYALAWMQAASVRSELQTVQAARQRG